MSTIDTSVRLLIPALVVVAMILVPPLLGTSVGWAQSTAATGASAAPAASTTGSAGQTAAQKVRLTRPSVPSTPAGQEAEKYASEGWSVVGPVKLSSADTKEIKYQAAKQDHTISLEGKKLTVVNPDMGTSASAGDLKPDTTVYVCQLNRDVVVILSPQTAKMREQRNDR